MHIDDDGSKVIPNDFFCASSDREPGWSGGMTRYVNVYVMGVNASSIDNPSIRKLGPMFSNINILANVL